MDYPISSCWASRILPLSPCRIGVISRGAAEFPGIPWENYDPLESPKRKGYKWVISIYIYIYIYIDIYQTI